MASSDHWKDIIREKLIALFENSPEKLMRVLWYLDQEEIAYRDGLEIIPPAWRTLKMVMNSATSFKLYAERMAEDTKRAERDPNFRETMNNIYASFMEPSDSPLPDDVHQDWQLIRTIENGNLTAASGSAGFARAWSLIPVVHQRQILAMLPKIVTSRALMTSVDEVVSLVSKSGGTVVMVGLAAVYLTAEAIRNLRRWWNGEISGVRCCKNIIDATFAIGGGVAGGLGGAAIGSIAGPIGVLAGGIIGGIISSHVANVLTDRLTQKIFGIPKDEALENAYNYFGTKMTASNSEINSAYRKKCLETHPDKGGSKEEFHVVQVNMSVIKLARGSFS